jgi:hypothetical protein
MLASTVLLLRRFDMADSTNLQIAETAIRLCCFLVSHGNLKDYYGQMGAICQRQLVFPLPAIRHS